MMFICQKTEYPNFRDDGSNCIPLAAFTSEKYFFMLYYSM